MKYETNKQWTTYRILDATIDNPDLADPLNIGATALNEGKGFILWGDTSAAKIEWEENNDRLLTTGADIRFSDEDKLEFGTDGDITLTYNNGLRVDGSAASNPVIYLGANTAGVGLTLYGDTDGAFASWAQASDRFDFRGASAARFWDDAQLQFGTSADITMVWSSGELLIGQATPDSIIRFGVDGAGIDILFYGDTPGEYMHWDQSADTLHLMDATYIKLGDQNDFTIRGYDKMLFIGQGATNSDIMFGINGAGINVQWYGDTPGAKMHWKQNTDTLEMTTGTTLKLYDSVQLNFGTGSDITMTSSVAGRLTIGQAVADSWIYFGASDAGINLLLYGDTVGANMVWSQANDRLELRTGASLLLYDYVQVKFGADADITMAGDTGLLNVGQAAADSLINIGANDAGIDVCFYGDTAGEYMLWDQSADSLRLMDATYITFGDQNDFTIRGYDKMLFFGQAATNSTILFGINGAGIDLVIYGDTPGAQMFWDQSADTLEMKTGASILLYDNVQLKFGTGADITMTSDAAGRLRIGQAVANSNVQFGIDGAGINVYFWGDTSGAFAIWNQTNDRFDFRGASKLRLWTDALLEFGDAADINIVWSSSELHIKALTPDSLINIGETDLGIDVVFWGDTAGAYMAWDQGIDRLRFYGGAHLTLPVLEAGQAVTGDIWLDTSDNLIHFYDGSTERTVTSG